MSAERFNAYCGAAALVALAGLVAYSFATRPTRQDWPQFFMGGAVAWHGAWDSLYPIPVEGVSDNPGFISGSTMRDGYAALAERYGAGDTYRFIQPPPNAVAYAPLAPLGLNRGQVIFLTLQTLCAWLCAVQAGMALQRLTGRPTRWAGALVLAACCSPIAYWSVRVGNVSPAVGALLGGASLGLLRRRETLSGAAIAVAAITKYAGGVLLPVLLLSGRFRAAAWSVGVAAAAVAATAPVTGLGPWRTFAGEIWPALQRVSSIKENQSLGGTVLRWTGQPMLDGVAGAAVSGARWLALALVLALLFRARRAMQRRGDALLAGVAAMVCWLLVFSPVYWEHYTMYLVPLWGWWLWTARRSALRLAAAAVVLAPMWFPPLLLSRAPLPAPLDSALLGSAAAMLAVACVALRSAARSVELE